MNVLHLDVGSGKTTISIIQSIIKNCPIICSTSEARKKLILQGKIIAEKLFPNDGRLSMPTPITYDEFEKKEFNPSLRYIFESLDEYFKYKGINVDSVCIEK